MDFEYFVDNYIFLNTKDYFGNAYDFPINIILLSLAIGVSAAICFITFHRRYTARLMMQLLRHNAIGEENAKTLAELRIKPIFFLKSSLSKTCQLTSIVKRVGAVTYTYEEYVKLQKEKGFKEEKINFETAKFYIDPEKAVNAKAINDEGEPSYVKCALSCLLVLSVSVCIALFMPEILAFLAY